MQQRFSFLAECLRTLERPVLILDLEATGGDEANDRITEIAFLRFENGQVETFSQLVHPRRPIAPFVAALTGISDDTVAAAPEAAAVLPELWPRLRGCLLMAHNSRFDHTLLANEYQRLHQPFSLVQLCTVKLSKFFYPQEKKHSLDALAARLAVRACGSRHRALTDVLLLAECLQTLLQQQPDAIAQLRRLTEPPLPPPNLPAELSGSLNALPQACGVVRWHGDTPQWHVCANAYCDSIHALTAPPYPQRLSYQPAQGPLHGHWLRAHHLLRHAVAEPPLPTGCHALWPFWEHGCLKLRVRPLTQGFYPTPPLAVFRHGKAARRAVDAWATAHGIRPDPLDTAPPPPEQSSARNRRIHTALPQLAQAGWYGGHYTFALDHGDALHLINGALQIQAQLWYVSAAVWTAWRSEQHRGTLRRLPLNSADLGLPETKSTT